MLAAAFALVVREPLPHVSAVIWAVAGGLAGGLALAAFYRSLAIGTMGINAPVAAIITTALPVAVGIHTQGMPKPVQVAGFLLAACSIVLVSRPQKLEGKPRGLGLAMLAGVGFGIFLIGMQRAGTEHVFWPLAVARLASACLAGVVVLAASTGRDSVEQAVNVRWDVLWLIVAAGALDTVGNASFMLATRRGRLDVAAAISSLYPVATVALAWFINHERVHRVQALGSVLALVAVPMIAA